MWRQHAFISFEPTCIAEKVTKRVKVVPQEFLQCSFGFGIVPNA
jgi:hypothetical protein